MTSFFPSRPYGASLAAIAGSVALAASLTGCGVGGNVSSSVAPIAVAATTVSGSVHGGQQGVSGSTIQLYAAGIPATGSGYGLGATPLLTTPVVTDNQGYFSITGKYTCPTPTQQVYIVATGGNPGLSGTTAINNTGLAEMAALGPCPAGSNLLATLPFLSISEVTTVAAVTALQQFMAAPTAANHNSPNIGAPTTSYATGTTVGSVQSAVIGMNNAFVTAKILADPATGSSPNLNYAYATPETAKINTIADILSYCINTNGTDGACASLFAAATPAGKTAAADTIQVAWYMAQNPINNLTTLYNFIPAAPPYMPTYLAPGSTNTTANGPATNAFNDTTIAINYAPLVAAAPAVGSPYFVAIDAFGNAWLDNTAIIGGSVGASVVELGADGSAVTVPATTFTADITSGAYTQFTTAPAAGARTITTPKALAIDLNNRAWITNDDTGGTPTGSTVAVFTGSTATGSAGAGGGVGSTGFFVGEFPVGIAIDGSNNVFLSNSASPTITVLDGAAIQKLTSAPGTANDGTYVYSTSMSAASPNRIPGGASLLAVDTNANVTGGIVWGTSLNGCKITTGQYGTTNTYYSAITLFSASADAPLPGSEAVSNASNAMAGLGSGTNCGSSSTFVGQLYPTGAANSLGIAIDRNNGVWLVDSSLNNSGFDGLTYLTAPTGAAGTIPSGSMLANGVASSTSNPTTTIGTTLYRGGAAIVDGNNNVWVSNTGAKSVVEASLTGTAINLLTPGQGGNYGVGATYGLGFVHNTVGSNGIAIDGSGNVWVVNGGTATASTYTNAAGTAVDYRNSVTVLVGAAAPVITPLALSVKANKLGTKP